MGMNCLDWSRTNRVKILESVQVHDEHACMTFENIQKEYFRIPLNAHSVRVMRRFIVMEIMTIITTVPKCL